MTREQLRRTSLTAALLALGAAAQSTEPFQSIRQRALASPSQAWLRELSDSIGPRLTGSPSLELATGLGYSPDEPDGP